MWDIPQSIFIGVTEVLLTITALGFPDQHRLFRMLSPSLGALEQSGLVPITYGKKQCAAVTTH